jgi:hypothetical protein
MRGLILAAAILLMAIPASAGPVERLFPEGPPASCGVADGSYGWYGAGCGVRATCTQALWGYHTDFLVVGGYNGCSGGAWVNPDESPEDPRELVPGNVGHGLCIDAADLC